MPDILFPNVAVHDALEARVARGVALLDAFDPGWRARVDVGRLAMSSQTDDVLGQLYGSYTRGFRHVLSIQSPGWLFSAAAHGFTLPPAEQDVELGEALVRFAALTAAWVAAIGER